MKDRSNFSNKLGFVLAAAGSAVGLGNIWRFPYLAAQYGGGTFLLIYLILAVTFGFTLMIAEISLGRKTGLSAIGAFRSLDKRFNFLGILAVIVPVIIFPYYSVIGGWVVKYFTVFDPVGVKASAGDTYFTDFIGGTIEPIGWFFIFLAFTAIVVLCGVEKGIEKVSKIMMPILVILTIIISVYGLTLKGSMEGLIYYIKPHMADVSVKTILAADRVVRHRNRIPCRTDDHPGCICIFRRRSFCAQCRTGAYVHDPSESICKHEIRRLHRNHFLHAGILCGPDIRHLTDGDDRFRFHGQIWLETQIHRYFCCGTCAGHGNPVFPWIRSVGLHKLERHVHP